MGIRLFIRKLITYNTKDRLFYTSQWIRNWINKLYSKYGKMWPLGEERLSNAHCGNNVWRVQFSSVAQSCPALYDPMDCSMPRLPVHYQLPEFTQTHVHWVSDAIQPSHPLLSPFPPTFNQSQHQGLFKWVSSLHQVAKVLEFQLQHQSFQWTPRTDLL